jgi:Family of unknown function (DUF6169)
MKFLEMLVYNWIEKDDYSFEFITDTYDVYWVLFKQKEEHFTEFCSDCRDIYEIEIKRIKGNRRLKEDIKVKNTVLKILEDVMTNRCHSIVYICDNSDGRAECRELLFDRYYDEIQEESEIEKYVKSLCDEEYSECFTMNFIADKKCENYEDNVTDFMCEHESKNE